MSLFLHYGCSRKKAFTYLVIFALMTPLGSLMSYFVNFSTSGSVTVYFNYILAVVVGIFLHVSTSILFETSENHKYNLRKFFTVCIGLLVAFGLSLI
jgi:zinc transporter ZupT